MNSKIIAIGFTLFLTASSYSQQIGTGLATNLTFSEFNPAKNLIIYSYRILTNEKNHKNSLF